MGALIAMPPGWKPVWCGWTRERTKMAVNPLPVCLASLTLGAALIACAPVEPFAETKVDNAADSQPVRDGREAAEDAARRIAAAGVGVARHLGEVARVITGEQAQDMGDTQDDVSEVAVQAAVAEGD